MKTSNPTDFTLLKELLRKQNRIVTIVTSSIPDNVIQFPCPVKTADRNGLLGLLAEQTEQLNEVIEMYNGLCSKHNRFGDIYNVWIDGHVQRIEEIEQRIKELED